MKKVVIMVIVLILALFAANTALGKFTDSSKNLKTAKSSSIDVKIIERSKSCDCCEKSTRKVIDAVSSIDEELKNLAPGDEIILSYKIVNDGCVDVLLDGVNITVDNNELSNYLELTWTLTKFEDSEPTCSTSNNGDAKLLNNLSGTTDVSFSNIILGCDSVADNYCILELNVTFVDDNNELLSGKSHQTVFSVTPSFKQY